MKFNINWVGEEMTLADELSKFNTIYTTLKLA